MKKLFSKAVDACVFLFYYLFSFNLSAYLSVFKEWSVEEDPGETHANIMILDLFVLFWNESLSTKVSFDPRKGTCEALESIALMHSFKANKLIFFF